MATVTTPAGDVLEGVTGSLLDYYRAEGYDVVEDEAEAVEFPIHFDSGDAPEVTSVDVTSQQDPDPQGIELPVPDVQATHDDEPGKRDRR